MNWGEIDLLGTGWIAGLSMGIVGTLAVLAAVIRVGVHWTVRWALAQLS